MSAKPKQPKAPATTTPTRLKQDLDEAARDLEWQAARIYARAKILGEYLGANRPLIHREVKLLNKLAEQLAESSGRLKALGLMQYLEQRAAEEKQEAANA